jgi:hypothetical protein
VISSLYLDTSALAKWYLNEARSEDFETFIRQEPGAEISRLTVLELRCLLARRRRAREIDGKIEARVLAAFEGDVGRGFLTVHALEDAHAVAAMEILAAVKSQPLRSLDALHLGVARVLGIRAIATADRVMALSAQALGMRTVRFD